jgi:stage II sporulation protein D
MTLRRLLRSAVLLLLAAPAAAEPAAVRIGVLARQKSVTLAPGAYRVFDESAGTEHKLSWTKPADAAPEGRGLRLGRRRFGARLTLEPQGPEGAVVVNGRPYRGRLELRRDALKAAGGTLTVVNELSVDDYVQGILVHEASPEWPLESLKAQAVISRSYALYNRGRHESDGFDLCNTVHCQVYGGRQSEREVTNRAVQETRGEALLHGGRVISAVFHSCCGGRTEDSENVWDGPPSPYLKSVKCGWCKESPKFRWSASVPLEGLSKRLAAAGHRVGRAKSLKVLSRSKSGRAYTVRVAGSGGSAVLRGNPFRAAADPAAVRSTLWTAVSMKKNSWSFTGRGWGHGVGLCQWGAKFMADAGRSHEDILTFYYRDVKLERNVETAGGR